MTALLNKQQNTISYEVVQGSGDVAPNALCLNNEWSLHDSDALPPGKWPPVYSG